MIIKGIDEIDNQLVDLLLQDGRMSYSDMAAKVGLSPYRRQNAGSCTGKSGHYPWLSSCDRSFVRARDDHLCHQH